MEQSLELLAHQAGRYRNCASSQCVTAGEARRYTETAEDYEQAASILRSYGAEPEVDEEGDEDENHKDTRYLRLLILTLKAALTGATGSCVAVDCAVDAATDAYDDLFHTIDYL